MNCVMCNRELLHTSKHHLIPRTRHHNKKVKKDFIKEKINLCRPCHDQIHTIFTEKELERFYNNPLIIKSHPEMAKFIAWIENKPMNFRLKVRRWAK